MSENQKMLVVFILGVSSACIACFLSVISVLKDYSISKKEKIEPLNLNCEYGRMAKALGDSIFSQQKEIDKLHVEVEALKDG